MLELRDVSVGYRKKPVLTGITGQFVPGVHALLGPNGAGKTTLFKTIAGAKQPMSGYVATTGRVGFLPQDNLPKSQLTVGEQIAYMQWLHKVTDDGEFDRLVALCDLNSIVDTKISKLSGGMRRRVAVACSLVGSPDVLLLDEPSVGLDIVQRAALKKLIGVVARDTVVFYSTHIVGDLIELAETVSIVGGGTWVYSGTMADFVGTQPHDTAQIEQRYLEVLGVTK